MPKNVKNAGFTLIEVLIYSFFLSFIMISALLGAYQIISASEKLSIKSFIEQEGNFILRKIDWVLTGANSISSPPINSSSSVLILEKENLGVLEFILDNGKIKLSRNGGISNALNSDYFNVSDLFFSYSDPDGAGGGPGEIKMSFKIEGQLFEITKYLRK